MFSETPGVYDEIYGFKDYAGETRRVAELLEELAPGARRILEVGCGTGGHARHLVRDHGYELQGLDLEKAFVELARRKVPEATFHHGDMADFDLGEEFDAVLCLFSSIGYLTTLDRVEAALGCFRAHLAEGGVALVEPWFTPESWHPGRIYLHTSESDGRQVVRMSHSTVEGRISRLRFHYLVGDEGGIEHRTEDHELGLFTVEEMLGAFDRAGFREVEHDAEGLIGRGMYRARRTADDG